MVVRVIPASRSQIESVAKTRDDGSPLDMPKAKIVAIRRSR